AAASAMLELAPVIEAAAEATVAAFRAGHKVVIFGNGGSAAQAEHLAAEFLGRFEVDRGALPAIALSDNGSTLTAIANDFGYDQVFARQIAALGAAGDVAFAISTSGCSKSVLV